MKALSEKLFGSAVTDHEAECVKYLAENGAHYVAGLKYGGRVTSVSEFDVNVNTANSVDVSPSFSASNPLAGAGMSKMMRYVKDSSVNFAVDQSVNLIAPYIESFAKVLNVFYLFLFIYFVYLYL
jgi:hypothetical protein